MKTPIKYVIEYVYLAVIKVSSEAVSTHEILFTKVKALSGDFYIIAMLLHLCLGFIVATKLRMGYVRHRVSRPTKICCILPSSSLISFSHRSKCFSTIHKEIVTVLLDH